MWPKWRDRSVPGAERSRHPPSRLFGRAQARERLRSLPLGRFPGSGRVTTLCDRSSAGSTAHMASKVWFITGTSRGFGRVWAEAALARGDKVAATARDVKTLTSLVDRFGDNLAALPLDVTDRKAVFSTVAETRRRFGRIDVAINNAGYGLF